MFFIPITSVTDTGKEILQGQTNLSVIIRKSKEMGEKETRSSFFLKSQMLGLLLESYLQHVYCWPLKPMLYFWNQVFHYLAVLVHLILHWEKELSIVSSSLNSICIICVSSCSSRVLSFSNIAWIHLFSFCTWFFRNEKERVVVRLSARDREPERELFSLETSYWEMREKQGRNSWGSWLFPLFFLHHIPK